MLSLLAIKLNCSWREAIRFEFLSSNLVYFNKEEINGTYANSIFRNYLQWTYVTVWELKGGKNLKSHNSSDCFLSLEEKKGGGGNEAPVEIIEAETFLVLLRWAAESKLCEKNKGGNVMCQLSFSFWLHAQSLNSY